MPEPGPLHKFKLYVWRDLHVYVMSVKNVARHKHHGLQITVGLEQPFHIETEKDEWIASRLMLIASGAPHTLRGPDDFQVVCQVMPWTEAAQALYARYLDETAYRALSVDAIDDLLPRLKKLRRQRPDPSDVRAMVQDLINALLGGEYRLGLSDMIDPRVRKALDYIHDLPEKSVSLDEVAQSVHLSPSRLRHLFKDETGSTFRNYVLQRRVNDAIKILAASRNVTLSNLAHETGFTDSAHLSRAFKQMTGYPPSVIKEQLPYWEAWIED